MSCKITSESIIKFLQYDLVLKLETSSIHVEFYSLSNRFYFIILCYIEQKIYQDLNAQKTPAGRGLLAFKMPYAKG